MINLVKSLYRLYYHSFLLRKTPVAIVEYLMEIVQLAMSMNIEYDNTLFVGGKEKSEPTASIVGWYYLVIGSFVETYIKGITAPQTSIYRLNKLKEFVPASNLDFNIITAYSQGNALLGTAYWEAGVDLPESSEELDVNHDLVLEYVEQLRIICSNLVDDLDTTSIPTRWEDVYKNLSYCKSSLMSNPELFR